MVLGTSDLDDASLKNFAEVADQFQSGLLANVAAPGLFKYANDMVDGFALYQYAYRSRLVEALRETYSVLYAILGDDHFQKIAWAYIEAYPSRFRSIRWFGHELADFLQQQVSVHASCVDIARMEWALAGAFDAADHDVWSLSALVDIAPDAWAAVCFNFHPSVHVLAMNWVVEPIVKSLQENADGDVVPPEYAPHTLLVWRRGLKSAWRTLSAVEASGFVALRNGGNFLTYCELMAELDEGSGDAVMQAAAYLQQWVVDGVVVGTVLR